MFTPLRPLAPTPYALPPGSTPWRRMLCRALYHLSQRLDRMAVRLASRHAERTAHGPVPSIEFHAEAGAPEGALYIDGVLFGHLTGISRL